MIKTGFKITAFFSFIFLLRFAGMFEQGEITPLDFLIRFIALLACMTYSLYELGAFQRDK